MVAGAALVVLVASALVGVDVFGVRERLLGSAVGASRPVAVSRSAVVSGGPGAASATTAQPVESVLRSEPWWQDLADLKGSASTTASVAVDPGAIQWRVSWSCQGGGLTIRVAGRAQPLVDSACPAAGVQYASDTGAKSLMVGADYGWELKVEQQVDVPLVEPPSATMTAPGAEAVASGAFYRMDQSGSGRVTVYRVAGGGYALRLDDFFVTANVDLELRFSQAAAPHSTGQYLASPSVLVAPLDVTAGSMNFAVPSGVDPTQWRSVVIWCPLISSAYAAAALTFSG